MSPGADTAAQRADMGPARQAPWWLAMVTGIGWLSAARFAAPFLRMAVPVWISRALGVEGLGDYQLVMSYYAIYSAVVSFGLWGFVVREMAADRRRAATLLFHAYLLTFVAAVPTGLIMAGTGFGYSGETRILMLIMTLALVPAGMTLYAEGAFLAFDRLGWVAGFMVGEELMLTALACVGLWLGYGLRIVVSATAAVRLVAAVGRTVVARHFTGRVPWRIDRGVVAELLRQAPVFFGATVVATVFTRLDLVLLSWLAAPTDVGLYAAALRFVTMCQEIPAAALATLFPRLSALHVQSRAGFRRLFTTSAKYLSVLAVVTGVAVTLVGPAVIRLLFGNKFDASVPVLRLLIWSLLPFSMMKLLGSALIATHNQVADLVINVVVLLASVVLKVVLIPTYGINGNAVASVLAMTIAVAIRGSFIWEQLGDREIAGEQPTV